jgi:uncharacterized protein
MNYPMKFLLAPDMKLTKNTLRAFSAATLTILLLLCMQVTAQTSDIPARPDPPHLVNDFAGIITAEGRNALERKLVAIDDSSSTQIAIVTVKSLNGYDVIDMATRIGQSWGIGQKGKNNGIVILVKPKTSDESGQVAIVTGYGSESVVTDALCKRIVENEIIPSFKAGHTYEGLDKAVNTIYSLLRNEFTPTQYLARHKKEKSSNFPVLLIIIGVIVVVFIFSRGSRGQGGISTGSDLPFWMLLGGGLLGGRGGSYGDFRSGGGDFGSSGGDSDFGGFGGGDFGGGGSSGSW